MKLKWVGELRNSNCPFVIAHPISKYTIEAFAKCIRKLKTLNLHLPHLFSQKRRHFSTVLSTTSLNTKACKFRNCSKLTEIAIPESVTSIGYDAFYGCGGLLSIGNTSKTQTTCTMKITSNISGAESGVYYNSFYSVDDDGCCTITGLRPSSSYNFYFGIMLDNGSSSRHGGSISVTTTSTNPKITQVSLTPESLTVIGSYTAGDAEVTATGFTGEESDGVTLYLTNLEPNAKNGGYPFKETVSRRA